MAQIVIFDPDSTPVANRVTRFLPSANTPDYEGKPGVLINPVLPEGFPIGNWKVSGGSIVAFSASDARAVTKAGLDSGRVSRWAGKRPTNVLNNARFTDKL